MTTPQPPKTEEQKKLERTGCFGIIGVILFIAVVYAACTELGANNSVEAQRKFDECVAEKTSDGMGPTRAGTECAYLRQK